MKMFNSGHPVYAFHILETARKLYNIDKTIFQTSGNVIFVNFSQARKLAQAMNSKRDVVRFPETAVKAGQINSMGLVDEILHYILFLYKEKEAPSIFATALGFLENQFEQDQIDGMLLKFTSLFPPQAVYEGKLSPREYLNTETRRVPNKEIVLEELLLLWLANGNPAFKPYIELFDAAELEELTPFSEVMNSLHGFFENQPKFGPDNQNIIDMLQSPAIKHPESLADQLQYIRSSWGHLLGKYILRLLQSLDFMKEEERPFFTGPGPTIVPQYGPADEEEYERFSQDKEWMPKAVLLAKSTYVWLDQMSKKYKQEISKLDRIPEEEIRLIASRGFNALWLIGLWERSPASRRIKQICGNPEAEASAYSLMEYEIADELGGWDALKTLRRRCLNHGIRLASDMVPNHTGIDSKWVINHPDWFIQLPYSPFPTYTFDGENLSGDSRVAVYIEDHYYSKSDAAVTFKRVDTHTGDTRYIYHGNDGTSMPWNDTAQLNFLNAEAREAVIQTILHVARNFSVIRFDAAMTLAKKHFQRLWFPQPGSGGDIPTRSEHSMTREEFNRAMPAEFWREVVDRIHQEAPDTLLLAEAFWFMEGYFVRTLGMHRVYNSAFMNMLKNEENEKYRTTIKNTQEFDPDILKRFVNFMNNPDEETAVAQFGTGDKYFGVCTLMVTMPGLPMFGHGQIEGLTEKYGMEYRRAYWEEAENTGLIRRHEQEIFPLMKKRYLFAEVTNFLLYDCYTWDSRVNENVFAYSNRTGSEHALIIYNNSYQPASGWINMSTAFMEKRPSGEKTLVQKPLASGLGIPADGGAFAVFREQRSDKWFIRNCKELWSRGLYFELQGYECHVFLDFYVVHDDEYNHYLQLENSLDGKGTQSIERALREVFMKPLHDTLFRVLNTETLRLFTDIFTGRQLLESPLLNAIEEEFTAFAKEAREFLQGEGSIEETVKRTMHRLQVIPKLGKNLQEQQGPKKANVMREYLKKYDYTPQLITCWAFCSFLNYLALKDPLDGDSYTLMSQLLLDKPLRDIFSDALTQEEIETILHSIQILLQIQSETDGLDIRNPGTFMRTLLEVPNIASFIGENRYNNILYFHKESFDLLVWLIFLLKTAELFELDLPAKKTETKRKEIEKTAGIWLKAEEKSGYNVEKMLELLES